MHGQQGNTKVHKVDELLLHSRATCGKKSLGIINGHWKVPGKWLLDAIPKLAKYRRSGLAQHGVIMCAALVSEDHRL